MHRPKEKALEYTVELVKAKLANSTANMSAQSGKDVADYFQSIYDKVLEIADSTTEYD